MRVRMLLMPRREAGQVGMYGRCFDGCASLLPFFRPPGWHHDRRLRAVCHPHALYSKARPISTITRHCYQISAPGPESVSEAPSLSRSRPGLPFGETDSAAATPALGRSPKVAFLVGSSPPASPGWHPFPAFWGGTQSGPKTSAAEQWGAGEAGEQGGLYGACILLSER